MIKNKEYEIKNCLISTMGQVIAEFKQNEDGDIECKNPCLMKRGKQKDGSISQELYPLYLQVDEPILINPSAIITMQKNIPNSNLVATFEEIKVLVRRNSIGLVLP